MGGSHALLRQSHSELLTLHVISHTQSLRNNIKTHSFFFTNKQESKPRGNLVGNMPTCDLKGRILNVPISPKLNYDIRETVKTPNVSQKYW